MVDNPCATCHHVSLKATGVAVNGMTVGVPLFEADTLSVLRSALNWTTARSSSCRFREETGSPTC